MHSTCGILCWPPRVEVWPSFIDLPGPSKMHTYCPEPSAPPSSSGVESAVGEGDGLGDGLGEGPGPGPGLGVGAGAGASPSCTTEPVASSGSFFTIGVSFCWSDDAETLASWQF